MSAQAIISHNKWSWIDVSKGEDNLQFASPGTQPGDFLEVADRLAAEGLYPPNFPDVAILVTDALTSRDDSRYEILLDTMRERWLWANTAALYLPGEGVFIQDHPQPTKDGRTMREDPFPRGLWMDRKDLEKRLDAKDPDVRFVPFGFQVGFMDGAALAANELFIGLCGDSAIAKRLAEAADQLQHEPCLSAFDEVERPFLKVTMLGMDLHGDELVLSAKGYDVGPNGNGMCAFGLRPD